MRVICQQEFLSPALRVIRRMTRQELLPLLQSVFLTARSPEESAPHGNVTLRGTGLNGMIGMITTVPVTVEQKGEVLVPIERLSEYVEALRPGQLTLSHPGQAIEARAVHMPSSPPVVHAGSPWPTEAAAAILKTPSMTVPLQIESRLTSHAGTASTNQAKLATWEQWDSYPRLPIEEWQASSIPVTTLLGTAFKEAITATVPLANQGAWWKGDAAQMYGVLVCVEANADTMSLVATSATSMVARALRLKSPAPCSFTGLFDSQALALLKEALVDGEMRLALAWEAPMHQPVLLLSTEHMTCFCRSTDAPVPQTWTSILNLPHEAAFSIRREDLLRPLKFLAGRMAEHAQALSLLTEGNTLWLCPFAIKDASIQDQRAVPLLGSSSDLSLLVDPKAFKRLVQSGKEDLLHFHVGHFERQEAAERKRISFLRLVSGPTTVMMGLSHSQAGSLPLSSPTNAVKQAGDVSAEAETREPVLSAEGA